MSNNSNIALQKNKKVVEFCTIFLPAHQKKKDTTEEEKKKIMKKLQSSKFKVESTNTLN